MEKIIIAAVSSNDIIGSKNEIPWHSKKELNHFKKTTLSFPVIMGRKTFETIGNPLKERTNIVITYKKIDREGIITFSSIKEAIEFCERGKFSKVFFIGGGKIFNEAIKIANKIILSRMKLSVEGDTLFPAIDLNTWYLSESKDFTDFTLLTYIKKN